MKKNRILTMLACLNCVHTTHAVEHTIVDTEMIDQGTSQESLDKLEHQYYRHNLGIVVALKERDVEMLRDEAIQSEEIMQKAYEHMKDALPSNHPRRPSCDALIDKGRDTVKDLRNLHPQEASTQEVSRRVIESRKARRDKNTEDPDLPYWTDSVDVSVLRSDGGVSGVGEVEKYMKKLEINYPLIAQ